MYKNLSRNFTGVNDAEIIQRQAWRPKNLQQAHCFMKQIGKSKVEWKLTEFTAAYQQRIMKQSTSKKIIERLSLRDINFVWFDWRTTKFPCKTNFTSRCFGDIIVWSMALCPLRSICSVLPVSSTIFCACTSRSIQECAGVVFLVKPSEVGDSLGNTVLVTEVIEISISKHKTTTKTLYQLRMWLNSIKMMV